MPTLLGELAGALAALAAVPALLPAWHRLEQRIARRALGAAGYVGPVDYYRTRDGILVGRPAQLADVIALPTATRATAGAQLLEAAR